MAQYEYSQQQIGVRNQSQVGGGNQLTQQAAHAQSQVGGRNQLTQQVTTHAQAAQDDPFGNNLNICVLW